MGKVSPVSAKYIVHATIFIDGVVDKPDVIGAIFGQTEGLLGSDLELRELQRSGRIGRIEVNVETRTGKTRGEIIVPSSLDKAETAIVAAALEIIQRIGPCNAKIGVEKIEDVRVSKRKFVIERAKELLKQLTESVLPDSQELADEVAYSVRMMEIKEYGKERLPAGPAVDESDEVLIVEGRADVLNLLKHGIKNAIAINGTSVPETIIELCKRKITTLFVDGDRGGSLITKEMLTVADLDFVTRAPDGKEVEEITKKEIHMALRARIVVEQARLEHGIPINKEESRGPSEKPKMEDADVVIKNQIPTQPEEKKQMYYPRQPMMQPQQQTQERPAQFRQTTSTSMPSQTTQAPSQVSPAPAPMNNSPLKPVKLGDAEIKVFKEMLENLIGTRGAYILDEQLKILGKVPITELPTSLKNIVKIHALVFDGVIDKNIVKVAERTTARFLVGMDTRVKQIETKILLVTVNDL